MFRQSDVRRVHAAFDEALPEPYEAGIVLSQDRKTLAVTVPDPDTAGLTVASCSWAFDPHLAARRILQPRDEETAAMAKTIAGICGDHAAG